ENFNDRKNNELYSEIDSEISEIRNITDNIDSIIKNKSERNIKKPKEEYAEFHHEILNIPYKINIILNKCGILLKYELKIEEIINQQDKEYSRKPGETITKKSLAIYKNRINLIRDIKIELSKIHKSLHEFFSIILLDEDILETLPSLNKIAYTTKDNLNKN
ncbi:hypothetical protein PN738_003117, partial [Morganella morganii]|nr:hypothetical protein [Morganella morganii]